MSLKNSDSLQFLVESCRGDSALTNNQIKKGFIWLIESFEELSELREVRESHVTNETCTAEIISKSLLKKQIKGIDEGLDQTIKRFNQKMELLGTKIQKQKQIAEKFSIQIRDGLIKQIKQIKQLNSKKYKEQQDSLTKLNEKLRTLQLKMKGYDDRESEMKLVIGKKFEQIRLRSQKNQKLLNDQFKRINNQFISCVLVQQFTKLKIKTQALANEMEKIVQFYETLSERKYHGKQQANYEKKEKLIPKKQTIIQKKSYKQIANILRSMDKTPTHLSVIRVYINQKQSKNKSQYSCNYLTNSSKMLPIVNLEIIKGLIFFLQRMRFNNLLQMRYRQMYLSQVLEFGGEIKCFQNLQFFYYEQNHNLYDAYCWDNLVKSLNSLEKLKQVTVVLKQGNQALQKNWTQRLNKNIKVTIQIKEC